VNGDRFDSARQHDHLFLCAHTWTPHWSQIRFQKIKWSQISSQM
jgi:hypothetical protein